MAHHHFPGGKDELVLGALDAASVWARETLERAAGKPAVEAAETFVPFWRGLLLGSTCEAGCAVAAVTVAADSPGQIERAGGILRGWRERLAALLAEGGVPAGRAPALAATLIAACEGAVVLVRAERSRAPFELVAGELADMTRAAAGGG